MLECFLDLKVRQLLRDRLCAGRGRGPRPQEALGKDATLNSKLQTRSLISWARGAGDEGGSAQTSLPFWWPGFARNPELQLNLV